MIRQLTPELAKAAKENLNENPLEIQNDLQKIKNWISKQPHLRARTDDQWLIGFLRGCKYSLETLKRKMDLYYTLRSTAPDITLRLKPTEPAFFEVLRLGSCVILPKPKASLYPRVILVRPGAYDPQVHNIADVMCTLYYLVQILLVEDDVSTVIGTKILVDYEGTTVGHLTQATPTLLKKMLAVTQESMPLRLRGSHHINMPSGIEVILTMVSGFLNEKAKSRLVVHKSAKELIDSIPKEIVPMEYGGEGGSLKEIIESWVSKVNQYKSWMLYEEKLGTDESKRIQNTVKTEHYGDGSFRKLDID